MVVAAATAVLGFVFTWLVFDQWLHRRKPHQLAWSVGLLMYAVAALMEACSEFAAYWDPTVYRLYIVLAASMVGYLGLGSYYLIAKTKTGPHIYLGMLLGWEIVFLWGVFNTRFGSRSSSRASPWAGRRSAPRRRSRASCRCRSTSPARSSCWAAR